MKYELVKDMSFYHDGKLITLKKGSVYTLATRHQIPKAMIYGQKVYLRQPKVNVTRQYDNFLTQSSVKW